MTVLDRLLERAGASDMTLECDGIVASCSKFIVKLVFPDRRMSVVLRTPRNVLVCPMSKMLEKTGHYERTRSISWWTIESVKSFDEHLQEHVLEQMINAKMPSDELFVERYKDAGLSNPWTLCKFMPAVGSLEMLKVTLELEDACTQHSHV